MRFGDERESSNFTDDTGRGGLGFGGGGGNMLGCLIPLIASRFGIGGVAVLVIGYFLLSSLGGLGSGGGIAPSSQQVRAPAGQSTLDPNTKHFTLQVLASTLNDAARKLAQQKETLEAEVERRTDELKHAAVETLKKWLLLKEGLYEDFHCAFGKAFRAEELGEYQQRRFLAGQIDFVQREQRH